MLQDKRSSSPAGTHAKVSPAGSHAKVTLRGLAVRAAASAVLCGVLSAPAMAIECRGPYQRVGGQFISTPYCNDNYLAGVARSYGTRVSDSEIRNNPSTKRQVCLHIGHDTRVSHICQDYRDFGGSRF